MRKFSWSARRRSGISSSKHNNNLGARRPILVRARTTIEMREFGYTKINYRAAVVKGQYYD